ncbi:MAG: ABC transporter ATP-binding protein [Alphaproteobacteria bacterium]|nr:MAG: ABC transporter ATP-binding protein [Alphaproteobacteria bacterium]
MTALPSNLSSFFYYFLKRYRFKIFIYCLAAILFSLIQIYIRPQLVRIILNAIAITPSSKIINALFTPFLLYNVMIFGRMIVNRSQQLILLSITPEIRKNIIDSMMIYVQKHSYQYFQNERTGTIANRINDVNQNTIRILESFGKDILMPVFSIIFSCLAVYTIHSGLVMILLTWLIALFLIKHSVYSTTQTYANSLATSMSQAVGRIVDILSNIINVKLFARTDFESKHLSQNLYQIEEADKRLRAFNLKTNLFAGILASLMVSASLGFLIYEASLDKVSVGDFGFLFILNNTIIDMVWNMTTDIHKFFENLGTIQQGLSVITKPNDIVDAPNAKAIKISKGLIEVERVNFSYKKDSTLFQNLNLKINAGEKIGLVGYSGSGKSSFAHLLLRLFDLNSGVISIDGQDIKTCTQNSLRNQISMIPQDTSLFNRTLYENIQYGDPNATKQQIEDACKKAHLHDFILTLNQGYQTMVGERGVKLSGGQRQRIAIARAILKNAPILILDEATSSLDSLTEEYIQKSLEQLMKGKTCIVIAHRLSTLLKMDRIVVFDKGKIIQDGTIEELKAKKGLFQKLWNNQMAGFLPDKH